MKRNAALGDRMPKSGFQQRIAILFRYIRWSQKDKRPPWERYWILLLRDIHTELLE